MTFVAHCTGLHKTGGIIFTCSGSLSKLDKLWRLCITTHNCQSHSPRRPKNLNRGTASLSLPVNATPSLPLHEWVPKRRSPQSKHTTGRGSLLISIREGKKRGRQVSSVPPRRVAVTLTQLTNFFVSVSSWVDCLELGLHRIITPLLSLSTCWLNIEQVSRGTRKCSINRTQNCRKRWRPVLRCNQKVCCLFYVVNRNIKIKTLTHYHPAMPFGNRKKYFGWSFQFSIFTI